MDLAAGLAGGQEVIFPCIFGFVLIIIKLWAALIYKLNKKFTIMNSYNSSSKKNNKEWNIYAILYILYQNLKFTVGYLPALK